IEVFPVDGHIGDTCIKIGENVQINDYVHIGAVGSITIGNNVLMASKIYISDHNHGSYDDISSDHPMSIPIERQSICKPVIIDDNVWIGESVCILPGVTIGKGCVIGALSVVTKDIPDYSIAAGNPAKVVKKYDFEINKWIRI
ncbi:MAG: DapH/DapD/GlmU-related protein, partial [Flavobacterium sp.]